jgi:ribosomal protein S18 acetylase RimI-like enzyme
MTTTAMGVAARLVDALAHRWAGGRWLATGGGGYGVYRVVPRAWAHVWLAGAHREAPNRLPVEWRERWAAESTRFGDPSLPETLDDAPNAGLPMSPSQASAEAHSLDTAELARQLAVPRLIREAVDRGWWSPLEGARPGASAGATGQAATDATIVDRPDRAALDRLQFAPRLVAGLDPGSLRAILDPSRVGLTIAVAETRVVGLVASAWATADVTAEAGAARSILAVGVAPEARRHGLATELLARHLASFDRATAWSATVTGAERDPVEPLDRAVRASIARRLLERTGFDVQSAGGPLGRADPDALEATRG